MNEGKNEDMEKLKKLREISGEYAEFLESEIKAISLYSDLVKETKEAIIRAFELGRCIGLIGLSLAMALTVENKRVKSKKLEGEQ